MAVKNLTAKISSIEAQLEILKASTTKKKYGNRGLRALKGILRGKGNFSEIMIKDFPEGQKKSLIKMM